MTEGSPGLLQDQKYDTSRNIIILDTSHYAQSAMLSSDPPVTDHENGHALPTNGSTIYTSESYQSRPQQPAPDNPPERPPQGELIIRDRINPFATVPGTLLPPECTVKHQDLELIHHYSFHTDNIIMMQSAREKPIWERVVPKVSFAFPYLSDALLAISALHLQHCSDGSRDLRNYALQKYYNAMSSSQVLDITNSFEPKFLTSCFLMMLAFSFDDVIDLISFNGKPDVFALSRGPYILAERLFPFLSKGPLRGLLRQVPGEDNAFAKAMELRLPAYENLYSVLSMLSRPSVSRSSQSSSDSSHRYSIPEDAIPMANFDFVEVKSEVETSSSNSSVTTSEGNFPTSVVDTYASHMHEHSILKNELDRLICIVKASIYFNAEPLIITWITSVSNDFANLARRNNSFAKVIIAYYMAALHTCQGVFWIGGRPAREVIKIANSLPSEWTDLMSKPLQIVQRQYVSLTDLLELSGWVSDTPGHL
ncbi:hypothetical protein AWJ20_3837 [Sugiyamaella lignohabitans]|uniref:Uncharacterized protein n=1 Tax=Sugiyamaella lignohabitans TaxID=796027 RepID=A0A161HF43_9ASCO|nr:uncharacterized protein AWJ20_3837 [Sugiyamaella lignohabitans]ANB11041.1 hypothetical protein AWJ20_3837 [Sugiyamaella lignohabitans]